MRRPPVPAVLAVLLLPVALGSCSAADEREASAPRASATPDPQEVEDAAQLQRLLGPALTPQQDGSFGLDRWSPVPAGADGPAEDALRVSFPEGSVSPSATREHGSPGGGMQVFLPSDEARDEAHLRYWVRLPADFEFVKGGKLPGLYGGDEVSGGEDPDGTDGFSTRLMWREDGEGEVYLYAPDESGTSLGRGSWTWPRGRWTCVEQHLALNNPDQDDGSVSVRIDGEEVLREEGVLYRTVDDLRIDGVFFSTFYGGADPSWAPSSDQYADFAGFVVSDEPVGCGRP